MFTSAGNPGWISLVAGTRSHFHLIGKARALAGPGAIKASQAITGILMSVLLVRLMSLEDFGRFSFIFAAARLATLPVVEGVSGMVVKELARSTDQADLRAVKGVRQWSIEAALVWVGPAVAATFVLSRGGEITSDDYSIFGIIAVCCGFCALGPLTGFARAIRRPALSLMPVGLMMPASQIAVYGMCLVLAYRMTVQEALIVRGFGYLLSIAIVALILARTRLAQSLRGVVPEPDRWRLSVRAAPFAIVGSIVLLNQQIGLLITGYLLGPEVVGVYRVADQFAFLLVFAAQVVNLVALPYLAEYAQGFKKAQTRRLLKLASIAVFLVTLLSLAALAALGPWVLSTVYGPDFGPSYEIMLILGVGYLFSAAGIFARTYLNMSGWQSRLIAILLVSIILQFGLGALLAQFFGVLGVATAAAATLILANVVIIWQAARFENRANDGLS